MQARTLRRDARWPMAAATLLGCVLERHGCSAAPIIMGLVLGAMVGNPLEQALMICHHNWLRFLERPIVATFLLLTLVAVSAPLIGRWLAGQRASRAQAQSSV